MLLDHLKALTRETAIYGLGGAASSLISFLLLPFYVHYLTPQDYGYLTLFAVFQSFLQLAAGFGLTIGLFRYYMLAQNDEQRRGILWSCLLYQAAFLAGVGLLSLLWSGWFAQLLFSARAQGHLISLAVGTGLCVAASQFGITLMRAERKPLAFAVLQVARVTLLAGASIYFVAVARQSYRGVVLGTFAAELITALAAAGWVAWRRLVRWPAALAPNFSGRLFRFVGPVFLINLSYLVLTMADRFFLQHFMSADQVGIYSFGNKVGSLVMAALISPFSLAMVPYAFSIAHQEQFRSVYSRIIGYFLIATGCLSLAVFAFSRELTGALAAPAYGGASGVIGLVLLGWAFYGLYYSISIALDIAERTYLALTAVISGAAASLLLNWLLIPRWGMYGAALTGCLANGLMLFLMYRFSQRSYRIPYDLRAWGKLLLLLLVLAGCLLAADRAPAPPALRIAAKAAILLMVLPAALWRLGLPPSAEWRAAGSWLRQRISRAMP